MVDVIPGGDHRPGQQDVSVPRGVAWGAAAGTGACSLLCRRDRTSPSCGVMLAGQTRWREDRCGPATKPSTTARAWCADDGCPGSRVWGSSGPLAQARAGRAGWYQIARLARRGCAPALAVRIVRWPAGRGGPARGQQPRTGRRRAWRQQAGRRQAARPVRIIKNPGCPGRAVPRCATTGDRPGRRRGAAAVLRWQRRGPAGRFLRPCRARHEFVSRSASAATASQPAAQAGNHINDVTPAHRVPMQPGPWRPRPATHRLRDDGSPRRAPGC